MRFRLGIDRSPQSDYEVSSGTEESEENYLRDEYVSLRSEILARSGSQHQLLGLQVTGSGVLGGLAAQGGGDIQVLLILPFFSLAITLLYLDHHLQIAIIGGYLRRSGKERLRSRKFYVDYRDEDRQLEAKKRWRTSLWFIFVGSSLAALVATAPKLYKRTIDDFVLGNLGPAAVWCAGAIALAVTCWQLAVGLRQKRDAVKGA